MVLCMNADISIATAGTLDLSVPSHNVWADLSDASRAVKTNIL